MIQRTPRPPHHLTHEQTLLITKEIAAGHRSKVYPNGLPEWSTKAQERLYVAAAVLRVSPTLRKLVTEGFFG